MQYRFRTMSSRLATMGGFVAITLLAGCADVPGTTFAYYLPKASATLTLTQSMICTQARDELVTVESPDVAVVFSRDIQRRHTLDLEALDSKLSDIDFKFDLTDDGRLKDINTQATGEGDAIAASAIKLITTVAAATAAIAPARLAVAKAAPPVRTSGPCKVLADQVGTDKAATLTYAMPVDLLKPGTHSFDVSAATPDSQSLASRLGSGRPVVAVVVDQAVPIEGPSSPQTPGVPQLVVPKVATVHLSAHMVEPSGNAGATFWTRDVLVPTPADVYLTIGKGAAFGKQGFEMSAGEAGGVSMLHYSKSAGLGAALDTASGAIAALQPKSPADQAAALNAQSDLIAAQQRLVKCKADPSNCS